LPAARRLVDLARFSTSAAILHDPSRPEVY
jgi:hypothetical protein